ncbi:MAG: hypothetical protein H0X38_07770 [Planctomycetes bacterium]|nr:hypothetical protein [Planctomycetota bacterium]
MAGSLVVVPHFIRAELYRNAEEIMKITDGYLPTAHTRLHIRAGMVHYGMMQVANLPDP